MKIVVLSDTHLPKKKKGLPTRLTVECKNADLIIHAGDWSSLEVYDELKAYGKVVGVSGNVDDENIRKYFPDKKLIEVANYKLGVVHGHGKGKTTEKRAVQAFENERVDVIIFGHSHIPLLKYEKGTLLFNPGSATDKRRQKFYSFGLISIGESIEAEHIFLNEEGEEEVCQNN